MSERIIKNVCDFCVYNFACPEVGNEDCTIPCLRKEDPMYKIFLMGYNKGLDDGYDECEAEYAEQFDELDDALQDFNDEEEGEEDAL